MTAIALIPSFEPDMRLLALIASLRERGYKVVVVDDGSGPTCEGVFACAASDAVVLRHIRNEGKGSALKMGLRYVETNCPEDAVVVTVDCDGQHAVEDVVRCVEAAEEDPGTLVLGCRDFGEDGVPLRSRVGNKLTRAVYRLVSGERVSDTQTGLRAFSTRLIPELLDIAGKRYDYEMNVLMECPKRSVGIVEVPIETIYVEGNARSHFRPVRDSLLVYSSILRFVASSFVSFLFDYGAYVLLALVLGPVGTAGILAANVAARLMSSVLNYNLNRRLVFGCDQPVSATAPRYFALAATILVANTLCLRGLVMVGVGYLGAKLLVEVGFFLVNWVAQNRIVFVGGRP